MENINRRKFMKGVSTGTVVALAGCSGKKDTGNKQTSGQTLKLSSLPLQPFAQATLKRFNKKTSWAIKKMKLPNVQYKNALGTWLGSSKAPDVYFYWSGPARGGTYVAQGNALKINNYIDQEYINGFHEGLLDVEKYEGRELFSWMKGDDIYGIPTTHTPYALWYNKNVLDDAGIDYSGWSNKTDMTVGEFQNICQQVKDAGYTPATSGNKGRWNFLYFVAWALQKHVGAGTYVDTALNRNNKSWTDQEYVEALTFLQNWANKYLIDGANGLSAQQSTTLFLDNKAAFASSGMWIKQEVETIAPDFDTKNLGFMWWPYFPNKYSEGKNERVGGGGDAYHISSRAEKRGNVEMAATFLTNYLGSDQFAKDMVASPMDNTPARNVWDEFDSLTYIQQLGKKAQTQLNNASVFAPIPDIVCPPQQSNAWLTGGQQLLSGKDPKSILQSVEKARQSDIEKYQ